MYVLKVNFFFFFFFEMNGRNFIDIKSIQSRGQSHRHEGPQPLNYAESMQWRKIKYNIWETSNKLQTHAILCVSIRHWYSSNKPVAPSRIIFGWVWNCSKITLFRAFHIAQTVVAHNFSSCLLTFDCICLNWSKNSSTPLLLFWILPRTKAHTFLAKGQVHSTWEVVSGSFLHITQVRSTPILRWFKLSRVGRQFKQALHIKVRTFGGTLVD